MRFGMKVYMKIYEYKNCSTCKKALLFLDKKGVVYTRIPIVDEPPGAAEIKKMLGYLKRDGGSIKNLFNTSGEQYRVLGIAARLKAGMSEAEAIDLLAKNGKLIKRPFVLGPSFGMVGFKEDEWEKLF
jgi:Spx/MgsR family transcriptional regulator